MFIMFIMFNAFIKRLYKHREPEIWRKIKHHLLVIEMIDISSSQI